MRILSITAGAAGMYCGSCFRDNALAAELLTRGHDVSLVPMYTPVRTDEPSVSAGRRVLFGGISVYLQQHAAIFRRTPRLLDRLWDAPRVISTFANRAASTDASQLGDLTISMLEGESGVLRKEFGKLVDWIRGEPLPDVINIPNSMLIALAAPLRRTVDRPVCCTLQGEELFLNGLLPRYQERAISLIRRQVPHVDRFIAVSDCAAFMATSFSRSTDGRRAPRHQHVWPPSGHPRGHIRRLLPAHRTGGLHVLADAYVRFKRRVGDARPALRARVLAPGRAAHRQCAASWRAGLERDFHYEGEVDRQGKIAP
jgi:hypothetical protein